MNILIGYDLNKPDQEYEELYGQIKALANGYWHHLDSTWIIVTTHTVKQVRDALKEHIGSSDELFVVDITGQDAAWAGFASNGSEWLKKHL